MTATTTAKPDTNTTTLNTEAADTMHAEIVAAAGDMLAARKRLVSVIAKARKTNLYAVRGFDSWAAYLCDTLMTGDLIPRMSKDDRKFIAASLVHFGISQRDAATVTDLSQPTVSRAVAAEGDAVAAEVAEVTGDASDAVVSTTTTSKSGKVTERSTPRPKGRKAAEPKSDAGEPVVKPKRSASAISDESMAVIEGAWINLTPAQRDALFDRMNVLYAATANA